MRYLFLDPGETTGYVIATRLAGEDFVIESFGEAVWPEGVAALTRVAADQKVDVVVIEDFIVRKFLVGSRLEPIKVIGAFELIFGSLAHWPVKIVFQQPSEKQRAPDQLLVKRGYWYPSEHIRDAFRHLIIYEQKEQKEQKKGSA